MDMEDLNTNSTMISLATKYSIIGGFDGDEELLRRIQECETLYLGDCDEISLGSLHPLINLLGDLHFQARLAVALNIIAPSPSRDCILGELYDYSFKPSDDDEKMDDGSIVDQAFVWLSLSNYTPNDSASSQDPSIATNQQLPRALNGNRYHIFSIIPPLLRLSPSCVHLGERYLQSASTRFQNEIVTSLMHLNGFENKKVIDTYLHSASGVLCKKILDLCKVIKFRQPVLEALIDREAIDFDPYGRYCSTPYVKSSLEAMGGILTPKCPKLRNWRAHGTSLYLNLFRQSLEKYRSDLLRCGSVWNEMCALVVPADLQAEHVVGMMKLLKEFRPCQLDSPHIHFNVKAHLEGLSTSGKDVSLFGNVRCITISDAFLAALPKKERLAMTSDALATQDFHRFEQLSGVVSVKRILPLRKTFSIATSEQLWGLLLKGNTSDSFLDYCCKTGMGEVLESTELALSIDAVNGWTAWHLLSLPTPMLVGAKSSSDLWGLWISSYLRPFDYANEAYSRLKAAVVRDRPLEFSQMTLYARYVHELINIYAPGLEVAQQSNEVPVRDMIKYYGLVLEPLYGQLSIPDAAPQVLTNLIAAMDMVVELKVLPLLELHFDPSDKGGYVTNTKLDLFQRWMNRFVGSTNPVIQQRSIFALKHSIAKASHDSRHIDPSHGCHFVEVTDESGKMDFLYFDSSLHRSAIRVCIDLLKVQMENFPAVQAEAWPIVRGHDFGAKSIWKSEDYDEYLRICCTVLTPSLRSGIEAEIVSHAFDYCGSKLNYCSRREILTFETALQHLSSTGLFERLVTLLPYSRDRDLVREEMGDFRADHVRNLLREKTCGRDADERVRYYIMWIERAAKTSDPETIATALNFLCGKLKNEAGMNRSTVYHHLVENTESLVKVTLSDPDVGAVASIAKSFTALLRNDLDRRDSVAHHCLHQVPFIIVSNILRLSPENLLFDIRSTWISLAVDMAWQLAKATGGNDSLLLYELPISDDFEPLPSSNWIEADSFDLMFPHREFPQELAWLRQHFNIKENVKDVNDFSDAFGPNHFVLMIEKALTSVWDRKLPGKPIGMTSGEFPPDKKAAEGLIHRLEALFKVCGAVWEESSLLSGVFDEVFGPDFSQSSTHHFSYACQLLEKIMDINSNPPADYIGNGTDDGSEGSDESDTDHLAWWTIHSNVYAIDRVSKACDAVFRYGVAHNLDHSIRKWYDAWFEMNKHKGSGDWKLLDRYPRALSFIVRYGKYDGCCLPAMFSKRNGQDETHVVCSTLQKMLEMSPSAVCFKPVRELLLVNRPDVACTLLCNSELDVKGVFRWNDTKSLNTLLYECITPALLNRVPFYGAREYARVALQYSNDTSMGMTSRTRAMEMLMGCPSTQHVDVLRILEEDIEQPILEALILRIFLLDSPWHVLSSLLSLEGLTKRNQSMVASLLSHVAKHVHMDKVVSALGMLLDPSRRQVVKVSLHKAIIGMLFQAKTKRSVEILQGEWGRRTIHRDVAHVMIKLSLQSAAREEHGVDWEWSLIDQLGARTDLSCETAVLLLSLVADRDTINKFCPREKRSTASEDEGLGLARNALAAALQTPGDSTQRRKRFQSLMARLEQNLSQPGLRKVAGIKKLAFSRMFVDGQVDVQVMQELTKHISSNLGTVRSDDDDAWIDTLGHMYGDGLYKCTAASLSLKNDGDLPVVKSDRWKEECADLPVAIGAQSFVRSLIDELMLAEEERRVRRKQLLTALNGIAEGGDAAFHGIRDEKIFDELTKLRNNAEFELKVATQCLMRKC